MSIRLTIILIFGSSFCYSQNWVFKITPSLEPFNLFLYNDSFYEENNSHKKYENISIAGPFGKIIGEFSPNFNVVFDIYQPRPKITLGLGLGISNFGHGHKFKSEEIKIVSTENAFSISHLELSFSQIVGLFSRNIIFSSSYSFDTFCIGTKKINSHFIFGFLLNKSPEFYVPPYFYQGSSSGEEDWVDMYFREGTPNYRGVFPTILFKYEVEIRNKKEKNLFNINFSYYQGFKNVSHTTLSIWDSDDVFFEHNSFSRGSSIRFGLSKTFNMLKKKENNESNI